MITIKEDICKNVPGDTSLFITFPYKQEIVDVLHKCEVALYDKKTNTWEVVLTDLAFLIDSLAYLDDLDINILPTPKSVSKGLKTTLNYKLKPFVYQQDGIEYGINHDKWLLLDDMGLGKSKQTIHIAEELKAQEGLEHCVIICCICDLRSNWEKEIRIHSDLSCRIIGKRVSSKTGKVSYSTIKERAEEIKTKIDEFFIIINIETFRNADFIKAFKNSKNKFDMIVVDEIHRCKDTQSLQGSNLSKLSAKYQIAATGTLLLNNPLDLYMPLKWLNIEKCSLGIFKKYFCIFSPVIPGQVIGFKHMDILKEQIANNSLRRTKEQVFGDGGLPPISFIEEYLELSDEHRKLYETIENGVRDELLKIKLNKRALLSTLMRLRQATSCPQVLTNDTKIVSSKQTRCLDLVESIISRGDKVIVVSGFKDAIKFLDNALKDIPHVVCTGDISSDTMDRNKERFQNDPDCKVMLCTWQKIGTGHTLTAANYMIHLDTAWTWGLFKQTCDRIYRVGAKKPVFIYNLICKDTVDEIVYRIVNRKKTVGDILIDEPELDTATVNSILSDLKVNEHKKQKGRY